MQCFYTGTKCQLAKSICAPPFLLRKGRRLTNRKRGEREQDGKKKSGENEANVAFERGGGGGNKAKKREREQTVRGREEELQHD